MVWACGGQHHEFKAPNGFAAEYAHPVLLALPCCAAGAHEAIFSGVFRTHLHRTIVSSFSHSLSILSSFCFLSLLANFFYACQIEQVMSNYFSVSFAPLVLGVHTHVWSPAARVLQAHPCISQSM